MLLLPRENFPHVLKDKHITKNRAIRKCDSVLLFSGTIITGRKALSEESGLSHVMKQSIQLVYVHEEKTSVERTFLHLAIDEHGTSPRTRKYSYLWQHCGRFQDLRVYSTFRSWPPRARTHVPVPWEVKFSTCPILIWLYISYVRPATCSQVSPVPTTTWFFEGILWRQKK